MDRWRLKSVVNMVNLSTPLGLLVARAGRSRLRAGPRGLVLAAGFRLGSWSLPSWFPPAFTIGNVVISSRPAGYFDGRPSLLAHEERHSWQYVACLGLPMLPLYAVGAAWSYLRGGDLGVHNPFERLAGLADGGYPLISARERRRQQRPAPAG